MADKTLWYLSRGTGLTSLTLLTLVLALGILGRSALALPGLPRFVVAGVHRNASLLAVTFLGLHVLTAVADPYAMTRLVDVVVPFRGGYRPFWVGLGTVTLDLVIAVVATSLVRHRLSDRVWRVVHWAAYGLWPLALAHGLGSGTDAGTSWSLILDALCVGTVLAAVVWRTTSPVFRSPKEVSR